MQNMALNNCIITYYFDYFRGNKLPLTPKDKDSMICKTYVETGVFCMPIFGLFDETNTESVAVTYDVPCIGFIKLNFYVRFRFARKS
jgi:hypothetical protein